MTDSPPSETSRRKTPLTPIVAALVALVAFGALAFGLSRRSGLGHQEERMLSGSAKTLIALGQLEEAEATYTRLLEESRHRSLFATYHFERGKARYRLERHAEARSDFEACIELDEEGLIYQARWNLAQTLSRLGDPEGARREFEAFIAEYGEELPGLKTRAENAIALLAP